MCEWVWGGGRSVRCVFCEYAYVCMGGGWVDRVGVSVVPTWQPVGGAGPVHKPPRHEVDAREEILRPARQRLSDN